MDFIYIAIHRQAVAAMVVKQETRATKCGKSALPAKLAASWHNIARMTGIARVINPNTVQVTLLATKFDFVPTGQTPVARCYSGRIQPNTSYRISSSKPGYSPEETQCLP